MKTMLSQQLYCFKEQIKLSCPIVAMKMMHMSQFILMPSLKNVFLQWQEILVLWPAKICRRFPEEFAGLALIMIENEVQSKTFIS